MKSGILVYDRADAEYNKWFIEHIIRSGYELGLKIRLVISDELAPEEISEKSVKSQICDFAIMRNRDYKMSEMLEKNGIRCFNSSYVCKIGNDKWEMYREFQSAGIPVMYTQRSKLPFPCVLKPRDGHGGKNVFLVNNRDEYDEIVSNIEKCDNTESDVRNSAHMSNIDNYIYQIPASEKGRDIRVYIVGDKILTAMERRVADNSDEFRANFSLGGSASEYALNDEEMRLAAKVADYIKADFVGIDIIYNNGKPVVNEIEDAVGTRMLYQETDIDAVEIYMRWIADEIK